MTLDSFTAICLQNKRYSHIPGIDSIISDMWEHVSLYYNCRHLWSAGIPLKHPKYFNHLMGYKSAMFSYATLGKSFDNYLLRLKVLESPNYILVNKLANLLIELYINEQDAFQIKGKHSFRFGPGYQGTPLSDLKVILDYCQEKNIVAKANGFLIPSKTIVGVTGYEDF